MADHVEKHRSATSAIPQEGARKRRARAPDGALRRDLIVDNRSQGSAGDRGEHASCRSSSYFERSCSKKKRGSGRHTRSSGHLHRATGGYLVLNASDLRRADDRVDTEATCHR